jgi:hypothetical protein
MNWMQQKADGQRAEDHYQERVGAEPSSSNENRYQGIDAWVPVDVKAARRLSRTDKSPDENIHWIEIKNVGGNPGWLYKNSFWLVFETQNYWIHVRSERLQEFIHEMVDFKQPITKTKEFYSLYSRDGRQDLLTIISLADLCFCADLILPKKTSADETSRPLRDYPGVRDWVNDPNAEG